MLVAQTDQRFQKISREFKQKIRQVALFHFDFSRKFLAFFRLEQNSQNFQEIRNFLWVLKIDQWFNQDSHPQFFIQKKLVDVGLSKAKSLDQSFGNKSGSSLVRSNLRIRHKFQKIFDQHMTAQ
eukprot:12948.XXX_236199_236570_1 [CDS] Oithona nana genome sequencing.